MKHNLFKAALCLAAGFGAAQQAGAQTLKATLSDLQNDTVMVRLVDVDSKTQKATDTVVAKNGTVEYTLRVPTATRAQFFIKGGMKNGRQSYKTFSCPLVPGEQAVLSGTTGKFTMTGSAFYKEYGKVDAQLAEFDAQMDKVSEKYRPLFAAAEGDTAAENKLQNEYRDEFLPIRQAKTKAVENYIKANPSSEVATALVPELGYQKVEEAVGWLAPEARENRLAPLYKTGLNMLKQQQEKEARIKAMEGKPAPAFTLNDIEGKPLSLESLRGKYVVLDFWGSWCGWCIKGMPDMKKTYAKHRAKLEILGVDCRDTEAKWKAAVKKHELPWKHVYNPNESDLTTRYNITGYPTKVIIDPQGNIVRTVIGEDPAFYTFIDELLK